MYSYIETIIEISALTLFFTANLIFQILIHEGGHLVFGLLSGYQFVSFRIFHLVIGKENGKLKLGFRKMSGTGGQCLLTPGFEESGHIPYFLYNAGGVIANLLSAAIFLVWYAFLPKASGWCKTGVFLAAFMGALCALQNGIPMQTRLIANDFYNILAMRHNESAKRAFYRMFKINGLMGQGKSYCECPDGLFGELDDMDCNNPLLCGIAIYQMHRLIEGGQYEKAAVVCESVLSAKKALGLYRNSALCEKQFCEIMQAGKPDKVTYFLKKQNLKERCDVISSHHTLYAHALLVLHDEEKAKQALAGFSKASISYTNKGEVKSEDIIMEAVSKRQWPDITSR